MTESSVVELLKKLTIDGAIADGRTQTALAKDIGVGVQYLNDVLHGRRRPSDKVLAYLGLRRDIVRIEKPGGGGVRG